MEGFGMALELLAKMHGASRQYRDVFEKDGAAVKRVESLLDQAAVAVEEENTNISAVISELKQEVALCEQLIVQLESSGVGEGELERLRKMLDESRKSEERVEEQTRAMKEAVNNIENRFKAIEAKKQELKRMEELQQRNHNELALYAQVTKLVPELQSNKICGSIMDTNKRLERKIELDPSVSSEFEICQSLWRIDA